MILEKKKGCLFLKNLKIELVHDPIIPLLGRYPIELKAGSKRYFYTPMFTAALLTIAKKWSPSKCPLTG
jgi:hypothetical protein